MRHSTARTPRILCDPETVVAESDCACPDSGISRRQMDVSSFSGKWRRVEELYRASLPGEHTLLFNPTGPAGVVTINEPARALLDRFSTPDLLKDEYERRFAQLGLLRPCNEGMPTIDFQPDTLTAWLHVTNACNLRCTYCYVDKSEESMDLETGRAAIDAIFRSALAHDFAKVKLKYAGGEATLNFDLVRQLHRYARRRAAHVGLVLHEVILSNGVALSNDMLHYIRDAGMRLMLSMDDVASAQDDQRIFINGHPSSHLAARAVELALAQGVRPHLSITLTKHNAANVARVVRFAMDRDVLFNLNFYREKDRGLSHEDLLAEDEQLIAGVRAAFRVIEERLPKHSLIAAMIDRSSFATPHSRPCGAGHNYLVVDQNGSVARCHMEIEQPITSIVADDPLASVRAQQDGFQNLEVTEKEGCRDCTWRYWCAGGCPLLTYRVTGRNDVKSPYCNIYKALYPDLLRLEGLRLLAWHPTVS